MSSFYLTDLSVSYVHSRTRQYVVQLRSVGSTIDEDELRTMFGRRVRLVLDEYVPTSAPD